MFKPETHQLEAVVGMVFISTTEYQGEHLVSWRSQALKALKELERRLFERYLNASKDQPLYRHLRFHQSYLIDLSDRLYNYRQLESVQALSLQSAIADLLGAIELLLSQMQKFFAGAFDTSLPVSYHHQEQFAHHIASAFGSLKNDKRLNGLVDSVSGSLAAVAAPVVSKRATYQELKTAEKIKAIVEQLLSDPATDTDRLFDRLYSEGFNAPLFARWFQQDTLGQLQSVDEGQREKFLSDKAMRLLIKGIIPSNKFDQERPSITEELPAWLKSLAENSLALRSSTLRLPLELSVSQLGFFVRLCYQTGCFHDHNVSGTLRFFAQHFTSKKQGNVSQKSLAKAFYSVDQSTAATCRAWLQRMIDQINKRYFPK